MLRRYYSTTTALAITTTNKTPNKQTNQNHPMKGKAEEFALKKSGFYPEVHMVSRADAAREQRLHTRLFLLGLKSVLEHFCSVLVSCKDGQFMGESFQTAVF